MSDLKTQLIKLGSTNPELRPHIREILGSVKGEYRWYELNPPSKSELESMTRVWGYIPGIVKADVTGDVTQSHWIVIDVKSSGVLDMPNARAERELEKIALKILNDKYRGDWDIKVVDSKKHALKQASSAEDQKRMMRKTDPSSRVRKQMEQAKEMGLTKKDILALVKVRPEEYTDLAVALGHLKAKSAAILQVGDSFENDVVRIHRMNDYIRITMLENAGRRGKKVDQWSIGSRVDPSAVANIAYELVENAHSSRHLLKVINDADYGKYGTVDVSHYAQRGVDITPAGFKPIVVNTKNVHIKADYTSFVIRDKLDVYNETTCIPAIKGGKRDVQVFYKWVRDNEHAINRMTFGEVIEGMRKAGIAYHRYCAMD